MLQPEVPVQSKLAGLQGAIDPVTPLYVLIDPLVGEPLSELGNIDARSDLTAVREQCWKREIVPIELPKAISLAHHLHPYLVGLQGPADPLLAMTLEIAEEERLAAQAGGLSGEGRAAHRIGGWLQSGLRSQELSALIVAMCTLKTEARTSARYLRVPDRRVLDLLSYVVGRERVAGQFGGLQSWTYIDACGNLCQLRTGVTSKPLYIAVNEWTRLQRGELLHRAIAQYLGQIGTADLGPAITLYGAAENALCQAETAARKWPQRFSDSIDLTIWAALILMDPSIAQSTAIECLLEERGAVDEPPEPVRYQYEQILAISQRAS